MPNQNAQTVVSVPLVQRSGYRYCNGTPGDDSMSTSNVSVTTRHLTKTTSNTPNYRALVRAKARLPDRSFSWSLATQTAGVLTHEYNVSHPCTSGWDYGWTWGQTQLSAAHYAMGVNGGEPKLGTDELISRLLDRARGAEWQAPVFFAEASQTVNMVLGTARDLATSYRHLRRGNLEAAYHTLGLGAPSVASRRRFNRSFGNNARLAASNRWLEMQYGWIPLLSDVQNAAETLAEATLDDANRIGRVTAYVQLVTNLSGQVQVEISPVGTCQREASQTESRRAVWLFQPTSLSTVASLGLLNPLSVAWELVPLSFVVDWFLPIGRYLEQLDSSFRFTHVGGTMGYKRTVHSFETDFVRDGKPFTGSHSSTYTVVERTPITGIPSLGLSSIVASPNLGSRRLLSGLALASQAFR